MFSILFQDNPNHRLSSYLHRYSSPSARIPVTYDSPSPRSMTAHAQRVYGLIFKILGNRETAEEVTLDIYVQVWRQA
ncbi:MAG: hypothetical protein U0223_10680 [Nitrospira sp.]